MSPEKFHNRYRISSARAPWQGYDGGSYFVTICTAHREYYLGKIFGGKMLLTAIGQIVATNLQTVSAHYQYAEIPLYVIMPNHLHAIVLIDGRKIPFARRDVRNHCDNKNETTPNATMVASRVSINGKNPKMQITANQSGWLAVCIGGIKSAITKYAHENKIDFDWQSRFHDHIVRDRSEMNRIVSYIENNVSKWETDCFYNKINDFPS